LRADRLRKIVIVGGGTAGWMTAAALVKIMGAIPDLQIVLIESDEIGTVGVGEATVPQILLYNNMLGIDENDFVKATHATYKMGIEFVDWVRPGHRYIHPFGSFGLDMLGIEFHHHWLKGRQVGDPGPLGDYAIAAVAASRGRFMRPDRSRPNSPLSKLAYAFQFDASLYARYLRGMAEAGGVVRVEGKIVDVRQHGETGFVTSLLLESGKEVEGELFIDCSGFRGLLIDGTMKSPFSDWSEWLPCDRALAVPCERVGEGQPLTRSTARTAGWQWRIPLQHRTGNGYVYSSAHISDDKAASVLLSNLDGPALADPRPLRFKAGCREQVWVKNVVSIGLAAGFLEPLESTSIQLVQSSISRLLAFFPDRGFDQTEMDVFNRKTFQEYVCIRDFLILHYVATERSDSDFWRHCHAIAWPEGLVEKVAMFRANGRIVTAQEDLFDQLNWLAVMVGQEIYPHGYHPAADQLPDEETLHRLAHIREVIGKTVEQMPTQFDFLSQQGSRSDMVLKRAS